MTGREVMIAARALIAKGWTQGEIARDADGRPIHDATSPDAVCWCLEGALAAAGGPGLSLGANEAWRALQSRTRAFGYGSLWRWNDDLNRTQAEVLAFVDATIAEFDV